MLIFFFFVAIFDPLVLCCWLLCCDSCALTFVVRFVGLDSCALILVFLWGASSLGRKTRGIDVVTVAAGGAVDWKQPIAMQVKC